MAEHRHRLKASVMIAVDAAFDALLGWKPQAPPWMRRSGLGWLFVLATEPRRLWGR
jgi:N-acetylglucosaminyldiphosphoundecaprenol N-acetyl-beta-D-mannosaminyltransferase